MDARFTGRSDPVLDVLGHASSSLLSWGVGVHLGVTSRCTDAHSRPQIRQSGLGFVALLDDAGQDASRCIFLVEGMGEILSELLGIGAKLVSLELGGVPLVLKSLKERRDGGKLRRTRRD